MIQQSESIGQLAKAFTSFQAEVENATKGSVNPAFRSKYADLASILDAVRPVLSKHGLGITQHPNFGQGVVTVDSMLMHTSGEWISSSISAPVVKQDPQGVGSAITYCRRYSLAAITGIAQEDDDGNAASGRTNQRWAVVVPPVPAQATPQPEEEPEWTEEEKDQAKGIIADLAECLYHAGMDPESNPKAAATVKKYRGEIGEGTFKNWANRVALACQRISASKPKDSSPVSPSPKASGDASSASTTDLGEMTEEELLPLLSSLWTKVEQKWNIKNYNHLHNKKQKLIAENTAGLTNGTMPYWVAVGDALQRELAG